MIFSFVNVIYSMAFMNKDLKVNLSIVIVPDKLPELEEVS